MTNTLARYEITTSTAKTLDEWGSRKVAIEDAEDNPEAAYVIDTKTGWVIWTRK